MTNSPSNDPQESRSAALARIEAVERSLEQLVASVRSSAAELQEELSQVRLSVLELHSHAVSRPTPLTEPPVGGDAPEGSVEGARLVALDLIGRGVSTDEAQEKLRQAFPGIDAVAVLRQVGATIDS
ncbi:MAG: hypothetical protein F2813_07410 [Actinobacteria bacterium]|uniref:Unannotated protein n=1 Tax=freshwater metagenome TaxID=449393 RepID=A0A6J5ZZ16_9ZZZZ|nr:hypothetical protein [Actinomycetota bacterium]